MATFGFFIFLIFAVILFVVIGAIVMIIKNYQRKGAIFQLIWGTFAFIVAFIAILIFFSSR